MGIQEGGNRQIALPESYTPYTVRIGIADSTCPAKEQ